MKTINLKTLLTALIFAVLSVGLVNAQQQFLPKASPAVSYNFVKVDGLDIFYREAGDRSNPTILLLHGFPTSSQMFRNLIPRLADRFHVIAPDYPGFGQSSMPKVSEFDYSFDNLAKTVEKFTEQVAVKKYSLYVMDYGASFTSNNAQADPDEIALTAGRLQGRRVAEIAAKIKGE